MKKILLPTDYSDNAHAAIQYALQLFKDWKDAKQEFIIMHAYPMPSAMPIHGQMPPTTISPPVKEEQQRLEDHLEGWRERYPEQAFRPLLLGGQLLNALSATTLEEDIDLVVIGTKGASGMEEVLLGSNAARVAKNLDCPVLIVPGETRYQPPARIVLATDFRRVDDFRIFDPLKALLDHFGKRLLTLNVIPSGEVPDPDIKKMQHKLHEFFSGIKHSHHFMEGDDPAESIGAFIREQEADWLVLIGKQRNFFESLFHRSVIKKMAYHTTAPMLVLH